MNQMPGKMMSQVLAGMTAEKLTIVTAERGEFETLWRRKKLRILTALAMQSVDWLERLGAWAAIDAIEERAREARERRT